MLVLKLLSKPVRIIAHIRLLLLVIKLLLLRLELLLTVLLLLLVLLGVVERGIYEGLLTEVTCLLRLLAPIGLLVSSAGSGGVIHVVVRTVIAVSIRVVTHG